MLKFVLFPLLLNLLISSCAPFSIPASTKLTQNKPSTDPQSNKIYWHNLSFQEIKSKISQGININSRDAAGQTFLHSEVLFSNIFGGIDNVRFLLDKGININAQDAEGNTALHLADKQDVIKILIERGAELNIKNNYHYSILNSAISKNNVEKVKLLLDKKAIIDYLFSSDAKSKVSPLLLAKLPEIVILLIEAGAAKFQGEALFHASDNIDVLSALLKKGINVDVLDSQGRTALFSANSPEKIRFLIQNGANAHLEDPKGYQAIHIATLSEKLDALSAMIKSGVDVNSRSNDKEGNKGSAPLHFAISKNITDLLIKEGAELDIQNDAGDTPLHVAIKQIQPFQSMIVSKANILLDRAAKPDIPNNHNVTPLMLAANTANPDLVERLIKLNVDVNRIDSSGCTALCYLTKKSPISVAALDKLLEAGASPNLSHPPAWNPVQISIFNGDLNLLKKLFSKGADINQGFPNIEGSCLEVAAGSGYLEVVKFLVESSQLTNANLQIQKALNKAKINQRNDVVTYLEKR